MSAFVRRLLLAAALCCIPCGCAAPQVALTVQLPESFALTGGKEKCKHGRR